MLTKIQALSVVTALAAEGTRVLNGPLAPETRNVIGALLISLATVINELDNEGFFDE